MKQLFKLTKISYFLFKQYVKILTDYKDVQSFFTELYFQSINEDDSIQDRKIAKKRLETLFPGIDKVVVKPLAQYGSVFADRFDKATPYLLSPKELFTINAIVKWTKPKTIFELGTFKGWTTANLAHNAPRNCKIWTLDRDSLHPENEEIEQVLEQNNIHKLTGDTQSFDFSPFHKTIDLVFVDACHSAEAIKKDSETAFKLLSDVGVIVWHDYNEDNMEIVHFLNLLSHKVQLTHIKETALVVYVTEGCILKS